MINDYKQVLPKNLCQTWYWHIGSLYVLNEVQLVTTIPDYKGVSLPKDIPFLFLGFEYLTTNVNPYTAVYTTDPHGSVSYPDNGLDNLTDTSFTKRHEPVIAGVNLYFLADEHVFVSSFSDLEAAGKVWSYINPTTKQRVRFVE